MIGKFIPSMESYLEKVKRYRDEFERQEGENAKLKKEAEASKLGLNERFEMYDLQSRHKRLVEIYNAIPEDERKKAVRTVNAQHYRPQERGRDDRGR